MKSRQRAQIFYEKLILSFIEPPVKKIIPGLSMLNTCKTFPTELPAANFDKIVKLRSNNFEPFKNSSYKFCGRNGGRTCVLGSL